MVDWFLWLLGYYLVGCIAILADIRDRYLRTMGSDVLQAFAWPWRLVKPVVLWAIPKVKKWRKNRRSK